MSTVRITILGCGDAFSSGGRNLTAFLMRSASHSVLVDCGATTLTAMKQQGIRTGDIDTVVLTHFHGDHFGGMPFFLLDMAKEGRSRPLTVISPPGGRAKVLAALALFYPGSADMLKELSIHYLEFTARQPVTAGPLTLTAYPVIHTKETLPHGVRLELAGRILAYSGDTGWTDALPELCRDADLFICECNFFEKEHKGHLNYRTLQPHLKDFTCKKILLTHMDEEMLAHLQEVPEDKASDGMTLEL